MPFFSIEALPNERSHMGTELARITINDFSERIPFTTEYWSIAQYEAQWEKAVSDIVSGRKKKTCLFTTMYPAGSKKSQCIWTWCLYREEDTIFIQNIGFDRFYYGDRFDIDNPEKMMKDRVPSTPEKIRSEWVVPVSALEAWLTQIKH